MSVSFRHYRGGDEVGIVDLWRRSLWKDPINADRFRNLVLLDPNFDPLLLKIAEADGRIVGALYAIRRLLPMMGTDLESESGWIPWFFVHPDYRRRGIAARLYADASDLLKTIGVSTVFFASYAPNYIVPGVDAEAYPEAVAFLNDAGFEKQYQAVAMDYSLLEYRYPEDVERLRERRIDEGYSFHQPEHGDLPELIRFNNEQFNPDWARAIREGVPRNVPWEQIVLCRDPEGRLCGFAMFGAYEGLRERFGPFGVDSEKRGLGLGKILLYDCLYRQRALGLHNSWFLWTGEQSPAGLLYKKTGFVVTRAFDIMKRGL